MIRRCLALLATAAALTLSTAVAAGPARAQAIGECTTTRGAIVAVDFSHWGGPIVRGCGVGSATGFDLLHDGGFSTAGDQHDGPAFICRLGNGAFQGGTQYPTPSEDRCAVTPPATAYWSYWVAPRGQHTWSYSQLGATSHTPTAGEVELWQFGATNVSGTEGRPTVSPDSLRATNTAPAGGAGTTRSSTPRQHPTSQVAVTHRSTVRSQSSSHPVVHGGGAPSSAAATSAAGSPDTGSSSRGGRSTPSRAAGTSRSATRSTTTTAPSTSSSAAATSGATSASSTAPAVIDASPAGANADRATGGGSPTAALVGGGLALVLAAGAGWTLVRRRRAEPEG